MEKHVIGNSGDAAMYKLTRHAIQRLSERTGLDISDIEMILMEDKILPLGDNGKKRHSLFYSMKDDSFYVIVYDMMNNEIITILPLAYHNIWDVSLDAMSMAKSLILGPVNNNNNSLININDVGVRTTQPSILKLKLYHDGKHSKVGNILVPMDVDNSNIYEYLETSHFKNNVRIVLDLSKYVIEEILDATLLCKFGKNVVLNNTVNNIL